MIYTKQELEEAILDMATSFGLEKVIKPLQNQSLHFLD